MKRILLIAFAICTAHSNAQEMKPTPQISVTGEGKVRVIPDQAFISVSVETKGNNATDVKKQNDAAVEKVIKYIKQTRLAKEDVQTRRVSLNPEYDYDRKKYNYNATQTIEIMLRDLGQYDELMAGLVDAGINRINGVEFKSAKIEIHQSEARKLAMQDAKHKAEDYVSVIGQKVGKALTINDNTQIIYPQPVMYAMAKAGADKAEERETVAIGEINVTATVSVSFFLE